MKIAEIYKAITAAATALAGMEGVVAFLNADTTHPWVHLVAVGFSAVVGGATWFVKNQAAIEKVVDELDGDDEPTQAAPAPSVPAIATEATSVVDEVIEQYKKTH
ncbi:hypothetical protein [Mycobacterium sp. AZCC_0083]|uniref:hypothetical protein n=1 Tax=Mycobacterium sp. AZCC_0083 TaxID=2735882 RepID=UPI001619913B|nr:hypothetical protein [Mycobacterium sp. AZCC_0083]MBB5167187.1 hypothetical protein [Mycobacterium sp. AZCC_0083]